MNLVKYFKIDDFLLNLQIHILYSRPRCWTKEKIQIIYIYIYIYIYILARETWVQSQVESYQRLKKWYLMRSCLTLSIIRYGSRVKWSDPGKGVAPSPTPWCSKLSKREPSGHPRLWSPTLLYLLIYIYIYIYIFEKGMFTLFFSK